MDKLEKYYTEYYTKAYNEQKSLYDNAKSIEDYKALVNRQFFRTRIIEIGNVELSNLDLNSLSVEIEELKKNIPKNCINTCIGASVDDYGESTISVSATLLILQDESVVRSLVDYKVRDAAFKMEYQPNSKDAIGYKKLLEKLT